MIVTKEIQTMIDMRPRLSGEDRARNDVALRQATARLAHELALVPGWANEQIQREVEDRLRFRFSTADQCFVLERRTPQNVYEIVGGGKLWGFKFGDQSMRELIDKCHRGDMQKYRPQDYVTMKRKRAEGVIAENDYRHNQKVAAAVDRVPKKRLEQFIEVETAIQTGEKVRSSGRDAEFLEKAHARTKKAEAQGEKFEHPAAVINPGMDPKIYKRDISLRRK